jgi:hypothetical protein
MGVNRARRQHQECPLLEISLHAGCRFYAQQRRDERACPASPVCAVKKEKGRHRYYCQSRPLSARAVRYLCSNCNADEFSNGTLYRVQPLAKVSWLQDCFLLGAVCDEIENAVHQRFPARAFDFPFIVERDARDAQKICV